MRPNPALANLSVEAPIEQFNHITLTEEETEEAMRQARRLKHFELARAAYNEKLKAPEKPWKFTSEKLFQQLSKGKTFRGHDFNFENELLKAYAMNLCHYFTGDTRFDGDLSKGLALFGNVGCGKTSLMKFFAHNQVHSFRVISMLQVVGEYKSQSKEDSGEGAMRKYFNNATAATNPFGHAERGYCFDDVGTEEIPAQHYGNKMNVFAEIIQMRHLNVVCTHFSSNKDPKELEESYGSRVYDRLREMFNIITFDGVESFR